MNSLLSVLLLSCLFLPPAFCRSQDKPNTDELTFLVNITITPGVVNLVEGEALHLSGVEERGKLTANHLLQKGDRVMTKEGSFAEILLHPGCYLRLAEDTEIFLMDLTAGNLKISLLRGDIIFETLQNNADIFWSQEFYNQMYDLITVITPQAQLAFSRHGIYRFSVSDKHVEAKVRKGEVVTEGYKIADGKGITIANGKPNIQPLEKSDDAFDRWSQRRAALLADSNREVQKEPWYIASRKGSSTLIVPKTPDSDKESTESYKVSVATGQVSFVEEEVRYRRDGNSWRSLSPGMQIKSGDTIRTGEHSRAEIMLTPQVYLRLSEGSQFTLIEGSFDHLQLGMEEGAAILEIWEPKESNMPPITVRYQQWDLQIRKHGRFRFQADASSGFSALVRDGEIEIGNQKVKRGKRVSLTKSGQSITSFNERALDSFDLWSRERNESSVVANRGTHRGLMRVKQNRAAAVGVWYRIERLGFYTFLPSSHLGYRSPYGNEYRTTVARRRRF